MWHTLEGREMHTQIGCENLKVTYHLEDLDIDGKIILQYTLKKQDWVA
jgi:hypothetical protein